ncbi:VirB8/TrbF family protein [Xanthomonas vasicola]|uniref:VirB8/TrbF family protein n=1 Tax=Xanthomonas vasicola TaxID=56459 RepID=UPI002181EB8D|nr:VirB8/TrbF family protein [Xanthomonas vasicola]
MSPHHDSARKGWTDKLEKSESDKRAWRWAAVGGYALSVLLAGGLIALSNRPPPKPLIARINTDGAPQVVGYASPNYTPSQAEIRYFLKHWVELVRTVPLDPVVVKSAWNEAYSFMTPASAGEQTQCRSSRARLDHEQGRPRNRHHTSHLSGSRVG